MNEQPSFDRQTGIDRDALWDVEPAWERELDRLARPALVVAPPADIQQAILGAVLQAAVEQPRPVLVAAAATSGPIAQPIPIIVPPERSISLTAYLLLAGVVVAYLAALSWVQGLVGGGGWLSTLAAQVLAASDAIIGPLPLTEPLTLTWTLLQRAPWIALLPLAWLLWERDRASASQAT